MSNRIRIRRGRAEDFREDLVLAEAMSVDTDTGGEYR